MEQLLRIHGVLERTGLSRSALYAQVAAGRFPKPVPIGERAVGWLSSEVESWITARVKAARGERLEASA
jgi:prophage regulatory protein